MLSIILGLPFCCDYMGPYFALLSSVFIRLSVCLVVLWFFSVFISLLLSLSRLSFVMALLFSFSFMYSCSFEIGALLMTKVYASAVKNG